MTSVMALAWALEPSAESLPAGQARPEALALLPGSAPPVSFALVGSEPHAVRLRVARAARAASCVARELTRRFMVMRVLHRRGGRCPLEEPGGTMHAGLGEEGTHRCGFPDAAKNTRVTCRHGRAR